MITAIKCSTRVERATAFLKMLEPWTTTGPVRIDSPEYNERGRKTATVNEVVRIQYREKEEAFRATFRMVQSESGASNGPSMTIEITFSGRIIASDPRVMLQWLANCGVVSALIKVDVRTGFEELFPTHEPEKYSENTLLEHLLELAVLQEEEIEAQKKVQKKRVKK
jgi:hypothetical protein